MPAEKKKRGGRPRTQSGGWAVAAAVAVVSVVVLMLPGAVTSHYEKNGLVDAERGDSAAAASNLGVAAWISGSLGGLGLARIAPESSLALAQALLQTGGGASAMPHLERAIDGNPMLWPAHATLGTLQLGLGDAVDALNSLEDAIQILGMKADGALAPAQPDQAQFHLFWVALPDY